MALRNPCQKRRRRRLSWGRALGPFRGLSTRRLLLPARMEEKRRGEVGIEAHAYALYTSLLCVQDYIALSSRSSNFQAVESNWLSQ